MTKEELIKRLIEMRKTGADETLDRVCESSTGCEYCPLYPTGRLCSHQTIDYLLDYIIENESECQTNLEHYWDKLNVNFNAHQVDGYFAYVESKMELKEWLLSPYKGPPKPTYKLTQFEYDLLDSHDCLDQVMRFANSYQLMAMKERGYFKNVSEDANIFDIIKNAEVVEE